MRSATGVNSRDYFTTSLGLTQASGIVPNTGLEPTVSWLISRGQYITPVYDLLSSSFVRWRVNKCKFHYTPQSTTTVNGRAVFAFADDPGHPVLYPDLKRKELVGDFDPITVSDPPTQQQLLAFSDSMAFAPWLPWTLDVSRRIQNNILYTENMTEFLAGTTTLSPAFTQDPVAGMIAQFRQSCLGAISCRTITTEPNVFIGGILWMELDFELLEFCPVALIYPSPVTTVSSMRQKKYYSSDDFPKEIEKRSQVRPLSLIHI